VTATATDCRRQCALSRRARRARATGGDARWAGRRRSAPWRPLCPRRARRAAARARRLISTVTPAATSIAFKFDSESIQAKAHRRGAQPARPSGHSAGAAYAEAAGPVAGQLNPASNPPFSSPFSRTRPDGVTRRVPRLQSRTLVYRNLIGRHFGTSTSLRFPNIWEIRIPSVCELDVLCPQV
jgi:hypothetical protein